jgi:site-specific recombinase XerD
LLIQFAKEWLHKAPSELALEDLDAPFIGAFLDHLEKVRGNSARTRNLRRVALRSFFRYVSFREPALIAQIQRILEIPSKRQERALIDFLTQDEIEALLAAPNTGTWVGRRDQTLLRVAVQTGLRLSELIQLDQDNLTLKPSAYIRCHGKGRKERCTPLLRQTARALKAWITEQRSSACKILFPNIYGGSMSPDAVQLLLTKHIKTAQKLCPSLMHKHVTPHVLRHTAAMELFQSGVDRAVIALWLGHESVETTQIYLRANLALKEEALAKMTPPRTRIRRYRPGDQLLEFLRAL